MSRLVQRISVLRRLVSTAVSLQGDADSRFHQLLRIMGRDRTLMWLDLATAQWGLRQRDVSDGAIRAKALVDIEEDGVEEEEEKEETWEEGGN